MILIFLRSQKLNENVIGILSVLGLSLIHTEIGGSGSDLDSILLLVYIISKLKIGFERGLI